MFLCEMENHSKWECFFTWKKEEILTKKCYYQYYGMNEKQQQEQQKMIKDNIINEEI